MVIPDVFKISLLELFIEEIVRYDNNNDIVTAIGRKRA
jgi:hypothetical protein